MQTLLNEQPASSKTLVLPFSVQLTHWHELFVSFKEQTVYHFEAFGGDLPRRSDTRTAFDEVFATHGWRWVSIRLKLQTDGSSCGVWICMCTRDLNARVSPRRDYVLPWGDAWA